MRRRDRDDLVRRLEEAGRAESPSVRAEFADRLEARLRAGAAPEGEVPPLRRPAAPRLVVSVAAAAVVAVAVIAATLVGGDPQEGVRLLAAVDTEVVGPDGTVTEGAAGLDLPEGALLRTGPDGRAVAGTVSLGPGETGVVVDGELRPLREPGGSPEDTAPQEDDAAANGAQEPTTTTAPSPGTTAAKSPTTTTTTTTAAAPPPEPRPDQPAPTLRLLARRTVDGTVGLAWTPYEGERFFVYLVLRAESPDEPDYPPRDGTRIVSVSRQRDHTQARDTADPGTRPLYRVVAVDEDGRELARSAAVAPVDGR